MATINAYSAQLTLSLLEDSSTVFSSPGSEQTGSVTEHVVISQNVAGPASDVNVKLGGLTDPKILAAWGEEGLSFKTAIAGSVIAAYPIACMSDLTDGLGISEVWVSNSEGTAKSLTIVAFE